MNEIQTLNDLLSITLKIFNKLRVFKLKVKILDLVDFTEMLFKNLFMLNCCLGYKNFHLSYQVLIEFYHLFHLFLNGSYKLVDLDIFRLNLNNLSLERQ